MFESRGTFFLSVLDGRDFKYIHENSFVILSAAVSVCFYSVLGHGMTFNFNTGVSQATFASMEVLRPLLPGVGSVNNLKGVYTIFSEGNYVFVVNFSTRNPFHILIAKFAIDPGGSEHRTGSVSRVENVIASVDGDGGAPMAMKAAPVANFGGYHGLGNTVTGTFCFLIIAMRMVPVAFLSFRFARASLFQTSTLRG